MGNVSWDYWVEKAGSYVKFKPDRAAVKKELLAHLEDKAETLFHGDVLLYDAQKQALEAMGDADEVGRQLAAVHKAWLGYLWIWSRRVLIICVIAAVWLAFGFSERVYISDSAEWWQAHSSHNGEYEQYWSFLELFPDCADESDGYTFTVPSAVVRYNETYQVRTEYEGEIYEDTVEENTSLYLVLRATRLLPMTESCTAFRSFYAVDDLGNTYMSASYYWSSWSSRNNGKEKALVGNYGLSSLWSSDYQAWISSIDPDAQWIELRYDRDGRDVRLRIDLTGGEGT